MIKIENTEVVGWEAAIRGMRNPKNSWDRMDSYECDRYDTCGSCTAVDERGKCGLKAYNPMPLAIGPNDHKLMMNLAAGGPVHAKYRRMIAVYVDITAPLYWWKEFDTYKVGTVANSCSTMHKIHDKEFTLEDFSCEHLERLTSLRLNGAPGTSNFDYMEPLNMTITALNAARLTYLDTNDKKYWWQMIQLLPSSYNQKRTIMLNYEVLVGMYRDRKNHKLDEWHDFCDWIKSLPYSEIIVGEVKEK